MTGPFGRWMVGALLAIALGVAGLELSVCFADERRRAAASTRPHLWSDPIGLALPIGVDADDAAPSAMPQLTY